MSTAKLNSDSHHIQSYGAMTPSTSYARSESESETDTEGLPGLPLTRRSSLSKHLDSEVDPARATGILAAFCFMTGFIDAISFSAVFVWCGFQTGNFVQLALAVAKTFEGPSLTPQDTAFRNPDQHALCSFLTFLLGAFLGRIGDRIGPHKRRWLVSATFVQSLLTMAAAITIWKSSQDSRDGPTRFSIADERGDPAWTHALTFACIGFMSASMGLQGVVAKRLNTEFAASIVLTTVWIELMNDPRLFHINRSVVSRDHKLIFITAIFTGGFIARALLHQLGAAGTLGIATGIRFLIALAWLFVPGKKGTNNPK
ncbi:hypothetical protein BDN71DRAFT_1439364 [Pleurotus eryngii]|uniref:DUF1275 domain protein n=1 Tax=Pleurotus eryngii TaxID=5323 RepID=A0A9P6DJX3_PLEER|nr:hypothetical protein BDN71DRAFT_1439364 [Pleurotus eryngii]